MKTFTHDEPGEKQSKSTASNVYYNLCPSLEAQIREGLTELWAKYIGKVLNYRRATRLGYVDRGVRRKS